MKYNSRDIKSFLERRFNIVVFSLNPQEILHDFESLKEFRFIYLSEESLSLDNLRQLITYDTLSENIYIISSPLNHQQSSILLKPIEEGLLSIVFVMRDKNHISSGILSRCSEFYDDTDVGLQFSKGEFSTIEEFLLKMNFHEDKIKYPIYDIGAALIDYLYKFHAKDYISGAIDNIKRTVSEEDIMSDHIKLGKIAASISKVMFSGHE